MVYTWGVDSERMGLLGNEDISVYERKNPSGVSALVDYTIKHVSVSEKVACALDSQGRVFKWGMENAKPMLVKEVKGMKISKLQAHQSEIYMICEEKSVFLILTEHNNIEQFKKISQFVVLQDYICLLPQSSSFFLILQHGESKPKLLFEVPDNSLISTSPLIGFKNTILQLSKGKTKFKSNSCRKTYHDFLGNQRR